MAKEVIRGSLLLIANSTLVMPYVSKWLLWKGNCRTGNGWQLKVCNQYNLAVDKKFKCCICIVVDGIRRELLIALFFNDRSVFPY